MERLIGTVRRELLDQTTFWNELDLRNKLDSFQHYYNEKRGHGGINRKTPATKAGEGSEGVVSIDNYCWEKHCRGLFQLPIAA